MSNQTIDVSGAELESICEHFEFGRHWQAMEGVKKLRALLEAPAAPSKFVGSAQYWSENEQVLRDVCRFEGLKGLVYQVVRDCAKPAAQPQGEPVSLPEKKYPKDWNKGALRSCNMDYMEGYNDAVDDVAKLGPLYVEQTAPVAVTDEQILEAIRLKVARGEDIT